MKDTVNAIPSKMYEIGIVYKRPLYDTMPRIKSSEDAHSLLKELINSDIIDYKEFFWVLFMNRSNCVLGYSEIGKGDTYSVIVNIKEIFQLALKTNASGLILCHNHPSGNLKKSKIDEDITDRINIISELFSITLLDHIIITSEGYYSFSDNGIILTPSKTLPY
jgi:DNA repair protein RadC